MGGKADGSRRELFIGVDDELMDDPRKVSQIPREDVAEVCVQCLRCDEAKGRSFDLGSGPEQEGTCPIDVKQLLETLGPGKDCKYSPDDATFKAEKVDKRGACGLCSK